SLNGGVNTTFTGPTGSINQTLWDALPEGNVTIRFYANDFCGGTGFAEVTIRKDVTAPIITITNPQTNEVFGATAPTYNVSIAETNYDSAWYTLDGGITNTTIICSTGTGTIPQGLWDFIPIGNVTIRFYANDTLGNLGFNDIIVEKDFLDTQGPLILGLVENNDPSELGQSVSIQINVFDISNISSVQIELDSLKYNMTSIGGDIYEYQWIPGNAENLLYTIYTNDTIGNSNLLIDSITIQDTILPTFFNLSESIDLPDPGDNIIISLDSADISGIKDIIISFEGNNDTMTNVGGDAWSYTLIAPDTPGIYNYTIYIEDNNNNINYLESSFRVGGVVSGIPGEPPEGITIPIFLGIIGILGVANIVLILKKFRGGKS
ncbi:MAG: hypothetical protein V3S42_02990, partial [Candidatus Neomarinimicrobiota bacterium]